MMTRMTRMTRMRSCRRLCWSSYAVIDCGHSSVFSINVWMSQFALAFYWFPRPTCCTESKTGISEWTQKSAILASQRSIWIVLRNGLST